MNAIEGTLVFIHGTNECFVKPEQMKPNPIPENYPTSPSADDQSEQQFLSGLSADELNGLLEERAAVRHGF